MACSTHEYKFIGEMIVFICAIIGFLGSLSIILLYAFFPQLRSYSFRLILYIGIFNFIQSLSTVLSYIHINNTALCDFFAMIFHSAYLSSTIWSGSIALNLFLVVRYGLRDFTRFHKLWLFTTSVFIPGIFALPIITGSYGHVGYYCSFKEDTVGNIWRFSIYYGVIWTCALAICTFYLIVFFDLKKMHIAPNTRIIIERLMMYPIIVVIILIPLTLLRLHVFNKGDCEEYYLSIFSGSLQALVGFFNAVIYTYTSDVKKCIKEKVKAKSVIEIPRASLSVGSSQGPNLLEESFKDSIEI
ncbi:hypothetical protein SteCoe_25970 [Stentor coeruleus]|uniref:G-protein coupled receptors family 2 profile 2 domain-containing protein n=1 Tax=Stentor coeruleus TaxID=5963 RepID=A0A1R2BDY9_9CILI|nr:hypothetical protein SteCoe_25970 [Stentor coeruleus]